LGFKDFRKFFVFCNLPSGFSSFDLEASDLVSK